MKYIVLSSSLFFVSSCQNAELDTSYTKDYTSNPHITADAQLVKINDRKSSNKGEIELLQVNLTEKNSMIGPMELQFFDVKELLVEPDVSMLDSFQPLTENTSFLLVKTFVRIKNTSQESVQFNPAAAAKTSTNEKWTWEQEVYLDELNGLYEPGQVKQGNIGFILEKEDAPTTFTLQSSDVFDLEQDIISIGDQIQLKLN